MESAWDEFSDSCAEDDAGPSIGAPEATSAGIGGETPSAFLDETELPHGKPFEFDVAHAMLEIVAASKKPTEGCFTSALSGKLSESYLNKLNNEYKGVNGFVTNILSKFSAVKVGDKGGHMIVKLAAIPGQ